MHDVGKGVHEIGSDRLMHICRSPSLPSKWSELTGLIRSAPGRVFWGLFAGTAGLSLSFASEGWLTAPPVDIISDPLFVVLVLEIILDFVEEANTSTSFWCLSHVDPIDEASSSGISPMQPRQSKMQSKPTVD